MEAGTDTTGLLAASRAMRAASPVFIVGEARSGTSILYRTLQKHPSFRPRTPNLVETDVFSHLRRTFLFTPTYPPNLVHFMLDDRDAFGAFLRAIRPLRVLSAILAPVNYVLRDRARWLGYVNLNHLVLRTYFFHAWRARGCLRLVEKTPTNTRHLPELARTFPDARFLYIHRHPVDVFTSYRRRAAVDPHGWWADLNLDEFCRIYADRSARALAWRDAGHNNLLLVPYERLTADPAQTFREVCGFLDEPFDPEAVEERAADPDRWPVDPHLWGRIVQRTKRWQDYLTDEEAAELQTRLSATMSALGYAAYPTP
ncbi:MAG: sulfotransferase [Actinomycetota bacterium]|nr:sulfotransferase [Actinomycetota bacterium]